LSGFLVDTSVLSLFGPNRGKHLADKIRIWFRENGEKLYLSSMTIAEVEKGIAKLRRSGAEDRADMLAAWLDRVATDFDPRILSFDSAVARIAGRMDDDAVAKGRHPGLADIIIAATAVCHDLTILTTNVRHFEMLDVRHMDPLEHIA
jgi:predicted nucleic acid-binding protein